VSLTEKTCRESISRMTPLWSANRVCEIASDDRRRERSTARLIGGKPSTACRVHERRGSHRCFPLPSPSYLSRSPSEWHRENPSIALPREIAVGPDRFAVNTHPGMAVESGFVLTRAEADVEHHLASTGEQAAKDQRSGQAGVDSTKPSTPSGDRTNGRHLDPRRRIVPPHPNPGRHGLDNVCNRDSLHSLRPPRESERPQKECDIDRAEAVEWVCQRCWPSGIWSHSYGYSSGHGDGHGSGRKVGPVSYGVTTSSILSGTRYLRAAIWTCSGVTAAYAASSTARGEQGPSKRARPTR
jgi:hypothetical protein